MPYQLKSGKWRAERQIEGVRHTRVCATRREALDWESVVKAQIATEEVTRTVTVLEWLNAYLDYAAEHSVKIVYSQKKRCARLFLQGVSKDASVTDITPALVLAAMTRVSKEWCNGTANLLRKHLSTAWQWGAMYHSLPEANPFRRVGLFSVDQKPRRVPTEAEFWEACAHATERDRRFLVACLHTAARKAELFRLRWLDVDFERRLVMLGTRKRKGGGMEYDPIPMTSELHKVLLEQRREGLNSELVFCHVDGTAYTVRERFLKRICLRAGIPHFSLHGIRHLTASILAREGVPMQQIQGILRHKRLATTENYISRLAPLGNVLEDVLCKQEGPPLLEQERPFFEKSHTEAHIRNRLQ